MVANVTPLKAWGIKYYEDTAAAAGRAARDTRYGNGGLGEYYSERDTRQPVWLVSGDRQRVAELTGLSPEQCAGGDADSAAVTRWFNDGIAPNGAHGRAFRATDNHGFDVTFSVPKSVSLLRAFGNDVTQKAVEDAANRAVEEAMAYLSDHVGYTRVHNPTTGEKDLQKLPGLVSVVYQHETSRAGDPQLHFHVTVPNKQAREDGMLVSIDSKSLHHEAKAAANIFHATYRRELDRSMGAQFADVDPHRGVSDLVGVDRATIEAYSQRSAQIHDWARHNLEITDPDAGPTWDQLNAAAIATRPNKPEHKSWAQLQHDWHHDGPSFTIDMAAQKQTRQRRRANGVRVMDAARAALATIDKSAFTRADAIERVVAALPTDLADDDGSMTPRRAAEVLVDHLLLPLTGPREAHHREGTARYTVTPVIEEERAILDMMAARDERSALPSSSVDVDSLSADQARAITNIATSPFLIQPLSAPAGAGKTTSLKALRAAAHRSPGDRRVIVLAPTGKAVDVATREGAGDVAYTIAKALKELRSGALTFDARTIVVVDEAGMVGTSQLRELLAATTAVGAKTVPVGDAHQLAPVKSRGGMFEQLVEDLPWAQKLSEVWRMRDPEERSASLALRTGGPAPLRRAIEWYRKSDRLRAGDALTMAADALTAYHADRAEGLDALLIADTWDMCDALNTRIHHDQVAADAPTVAAARGHRIAAGDVIVSRRNDPTLTLYNDRAQPSEGLDPVRNGNRWLVEAVDPEKGRIAARRIGDNARAVFSGDYLNEHIHHGYALTLQASQGATADTTHTLVSASSSRGALYMGLTRGRDRNTAFVYEKDSELGEFEHSSDGLTPDIHTAHRGTSHHAAHLVRSIAARDDRPRTLIHTAAEAATNGPATDTTRPQQIIELLTHHQRARVHVQAQHRARAVELAAHTAELAAGQHWLDEHLTRARGERGRARDTGPDLSL